MKLGKCLVVSVALTILAANSLAATIYSDKAVFLAATGAAATDPLPLTAGTVTSLTVGDLTFTPNPSPNLATGTFSNRLAGNVISVSSAENLNVDLAAPVLAIGFDFHEPEFDPNLFDVFVDSTFDVTLRNGAIPVDTFQFSAPNDTAAFVGVSSPVAFNRVEIRETIGGSENEFFGQFYARCAGAECTSDGRDWGGLRVIVVALAAGSRAWRGPNHCFPNRARLSWRHGHRTRMSDRRTGRFSPRRTMTAKPQAAGAHSRWAGRALVAGVAAVLSVTLAAAPWNQWYLAWFGLAPWLVAVGQWPRMRSAVLFGCGTGWLYFALNLWWLWTATIPGTVGLILYFGMYWGIAAGLIHYLRLSRLDAPAPPVVVQVVGTAVVWVATEWLRCNLLSGFPWLPIGTTQSPVVMMCQVADLGGIWAVSFWVVLVNALVAAWWRYRHEPKLLWGVTATVVIVLIGVSAYGAWRLGTTMRRAGPRVMVLQSNHPHLRGGASTTTPERAAEFFLSELGTRLAVDQVDLVILPENEFPPLNDEARSELARSSVGPFLEHTHRQLAAIAREHGTAILVGGAAVGGWTTEGNEHVGTEIYNSAYFYNPWNESPVRRYDKIYLVPFSERVPFASASAWLRRTAMYLAANRAVQPLRAGTMQAFAPFVLAWSGGTGAAVGPAGLPSTAQRRAAFVSPICLENIDPAVVAGMIWDSTRSQKRADFIANLSNDGWFHAQEKHQHLQNLVFRCIENRVPMARSSNTGISGFVDSTGRIQSILPTNKTGALTHAMELDDRVTFYTRHGDIFAGLCMLAAGVGIVIRAARWRSAEESFCSRAFEVR